MIKIYKGNKRMFLENPESTSKHVVSVLIPDFVTWPVPRQTAAILAHVLCSLHPTTWPCYQFTVWFNVTYLGFSCNLFWSLFILRGNCEKSNKRQKTLVVIIFWPVPNWILFHPLGWKHEMTFDSFCTPQAQSLRLPGYQIAYIVWGKLVRVLGIPNTTALLGHAFQSSHQLKAPQGLES